jgi:hypothetical protein
MLINKNINTNSWHQSDVDLNDITAVQNSGEDWHISIFNIYHSGTDSSTLEKLSTHFATSWQSIHSSQTDHVMWLRDFNRHHPMWEHEQNHHLCEGCGARVAQPLINLLLDYNMQMVLRARHHTLRLKSDHSVLTRPDNVFLYSNSLDLVIHFRILYGREGPGANHFPIDMLINLHLEHQPAAPPWTRLHQVDVTTPRLTGRNSARTYKGVSLPGRRMHLPQQPD